MTLSVADLVSPEQVQELARPSNLTAGIKIHEQGGVQLIERSSHKIRAKVGGTAEAPTRRTAELAVEQGALAWSCTCAMESSFCKHCVALALEARREASTSSH